MNLSVIERLARNGDMSVDSLRYLLGCKGECEWLDYKESLHIETDRELCNFAKDVLAIKNTGGGFIIVGVEDKTWIPHGMPSSLLYDGKLLRDKVRKASGLELDVDIVGHSIYINGRIRTYAMILIRSSKKS